MSKLQVFHKIMKRREKMRKKAAKAAKKQAELEAAANAHLTGTLQHSSDYLLPVIVIPR